MYTLRPYQQDCVKATVHYFRKHSTPAVLALPTGAGKSLVIAELARIARGRVLVLTHVKELVEQNHAKYESYGLNASIFQPGWAGKKLISKSFLLQCNLWSTALSNLTMSFPCWS